MITSPVRTCPTEVFADIANVIQMFICLKYLVLAYIINQVIHNLKSKILESICEIWLKSDIYTYTSNPMHDMWNQFVKDFKSMITSLYDLCSNMLSYL